MSSNKRKGDHYRKEFKLEVISYAAKTSITKAAEKFNVHHSSISLWIQEKKLQDRISAGDGDHETCGDLNIGKLCESSFIDWLTNNLSTLTYESIREQVNLLKIIYQNIPTWLSNYSDRLEDPDLKNSTVHTLYPPQFKSLVVSFSDLSKLSQSHVSKIFRISRKQLSEWQKTYKLKGNLNKAVRTSKNLLTNAEVDEAIWQWYQAQSVPPSTNSVKQKALSLYHASGYTNMKCSYGWYYKWCARYKIPYKDKNQHVETQLLLWTLEQIDQNTPPSHEDIRLQAAQLSSDPNFKASAGWVQRFCRRHSLLFGNNSVNEDLLPSFIQEKFSAFKSDLEKFVSERELPPQSVYIVDELALDFRNSSSLIPHRTLEYSLASCIVACDMTGSMLPLLLVLKDTTSKVEVVSKDLTIYHYTEANPHENCFRFWLENIWFPTIGTSSLLLADSYSVHQKPWVQSMFENRNSSMKIVPSSWIPLSSPLGQLSSGFSQSIYNMWKTCADDVTQDIDNSTVVRWVTNAFELIKQKK
ncbi:hypothetical protein M8J76_010336 [Diaphorina citri]|nr:hypothetical protein M8J76_010336 [Diaphorina citri]